MFMMHVTVLFGGQNTAAACLEPHSNYIFGMTPFWVFVPAFLGVLPENSIAAGDETGILQVFCFTVIHKS